MAGLTFKEKAKIVLNQIEFTEHTQTDIDYLAKILELEYSAGKLDGAKVPHSLGDYFDKV